MSTAMSASFDPFLALDPSIHLVDTHGALFIGLLISAMSVFISSDIRRADCLFFPRNM
jgi:hypothetical protein